MSHQLGFFLFVSDLTFFTLGPPSQVKCEMTPLQRSAQALHCCRSVKSVVDESKMIGLTSINLNTTASVRHQHLNLLHVWRIEFIQNCSYRDNDKKINSNININ